MNFFQPVPPALKSWTSMPVFIATMAVTVLMPAGMAIWMRRHGRM